MRERAYQTQNVESRHSVDHPDLHEEYQDSRVNTCSVLSEFAARLFLSVCVAASECLPSKYRELVSGMGKTTIELTGEVQKNYTDVRRLADARQRFFLRFSM